MRKSVRASILEIIGTLYDAHDSVSSLIEKNEYDSALSLLGDCQNTAVEIGSVIENSEGEGFCTIRLLEEYCEVLYQVSTGFNEGIAGKKAKKMLDKSLIRIENSVKNDIKVRLEIVFMPYKASMWDSLESVWKAADEDPDCDAHVVPIPYYDRNVDHTFGKYHYEGKDFPEYVPIVYYENYDLEARRPDVIFVHNPYDGNNYVTSVDPEYYSDKLKKHTDCLVYIEYGIPLYVFKEPVTLDKYDGILNSWFIFDIYVVFSKVVENNLKYAFGSYMPDYKTDVIALGSPKFDKIVNSTRSDFHIPDEWQALMAGKKTVLLNTSLRIMLKDSEKYLNRLTEVLEIFKNSDEVTLWWRPHPLMESTFKSMRVDLYEKYTDIVSKYISEAWGIYDTDSDADRAIICTDAYYGDVSSLVYLYCATGKPFSIVDFPYDCYMFTENTDRFDKCLDWRIKNMQSAPGANTFNYNDMIWWPNFYEDLDYKKFLKLYLDYVTHPQEYPQSDLYRELQIKLYQEFVENYDGTAGKKIFEYTKDHALHDKRSCAGR